MKSKLLLVFISGMMLHAINPASAQTCTAPADDTSAFPTGNRWNAYCFREMNFTNYHGRAYFGSTGNSNFDVDFGSGGYRPGTSNFNCNLTTETFSVRAKVRRNFTTSRTYDFTVGSDDGVRLYIDGKLVIDEWNEHPYATFTIPVYITSGYHNLVLEYYENTGENRISFDISNSACNQAPVTESYGSGNWWQAYYYVGKNFVTYRRNDFAGSAGSPLINMNFGGDDVMMNGGGCSVRTEHFSARFKLTRNFPAGRYLFTVGGDDGYRLSLDGGATWVIDNWSDHGNVTTATAVNLPGGNVNMVLEYYENSGANAIFFDYGVVLPVTLIKFEGKQNNGESTLSWQTTPESTEDRFVVERSTNGRNFDPVGEVKVSEAVAAANGNRQYYFKDRNAPVGSSWYRLKMIDQNGPEKYSSIVNINTKAQAIAKIYPTLIDQNKQLFIQTDRSTADLEVVIRNISGQQLLNKKLGTMARGQIATLPLQELPLSKGTYVVQVLAGGVIMHKQLIIVSQ